jgi:hypothetical protein
MTCSPEVVGGDSCHQIPGTREREAALEITRPNGTTLVLKTSWATYGFAGDAPHVAVPVKLAMIDDEAALAAQLRRWAELPSLKRIVVSRGSTIEDDPRRALLDLAASLE